MIQINNLANMIFTHFTFRIPIINDYLFHTKPTKLFNKNKWYWLSLKKIDGNLTIGTNSSNKYNTQYANH